MSSLELTEWAAFFRARDMQRSTGSATPLDPEHAAALSNPGLQAALDDRDARHRAGRDSDTPGVVAPVVLE